MRIRTELIASVLTVIMVPLASMSTALAQNQRPYRYADNYMRQLINRIETRSDHFSNLLPDALDRSRVEGTRREDDINRLVTEFEYATDQLKQHFQNRQSTTVDAERVLEQGALINRFMNNHRLNNRTEQSWALVRSDLNNLASAFNVADNWATREWPVRNNNVADYKALLTGTYRLNLTLSNNPRSVADYATRNLPSDQRERIRTRLINRLTPPQEIALDRRGDRVTLASTLSPRVTLVVDGTAHREMYPNGRASQVRANFYGDRLTVVSNGDRANDFTVSFAPTNNDQRLLVTREVYAERLNTPVLVQSYYDKTSDVAQWNLYTPNSNYPTTGFPRGNFFIPGGTKLVAVLNEPLSTNRTRVNERFTMTVHEPSQYRNAIIEGYVTDIDRGGRIAGRSEMTFNFDRIRINGKTYNFAGIVEEVRAPNDESVRVDNEGSVQEENRTGTTVERTAIGSAVGALVGAIAGGGKGAAIGAAVGAGAGAGSVYVQGHDDLTLPTGTEIRVRSTAP